MVISATLRNVLLGIGVIFFAFLLPKDVHSQAFSIFNVDASGYPTIKAGFFVTNGNGQPVDGLLSDFTITDNGVNVTPSLKVNCREAGQCDLSISMIVDKSGSMLDPISPGKTRWDAVKFGVNSFLNSIDFNGKNELSLASFDGMGFLNQDFTTAKQPIIDALNFINPSNSTKYNEVLLTALRDPLDYRKIIIGDGTIGMLSRRNPNNCKVILFLTDGLPIEATNVAEVVQRCQDNAIRFFSISIGVDAPELKQIANATGGRAFVVPNINEQSIKAVYDAIAAELKGTKVCELEWTAPYGCTQSSRQRLSLVRFNRAGLINKLDTARYTAPDYSVAPIIASSQVLSFGDVDPNLSVDGELTFRVPIDGYTITSVAPFPTIPQYQVFEITVNNIVRTPPFQMNKSDILKVKVRFTQGATKMFHQTELVVNGIPCNAKIPLVGGLQTVRLIKPDGSETISTCDTFPIVWAGVDSTTPVNLFFRASQDDNWTPIATSVTGNVYLWNPSVKGTGYQVRVTLPPASIYQWVKQVGSSGPDSVSSIDLNGNEDLLYSTGVFSNTVTFNQNTTFTSSGFKDIYIGQQNPISGDFNWVTKVSSPLDEVSSGIIADGNNIWVAGSTYSTGSIGVSPINFEVPNKMGMFLARLDPLTGSASIVNTDVSASTNWNQFEAYPEQIAIATTSQNQKRILVTGKYRNQLAASALRTLPNSSTWQQFTATFNENGQLALPLSLGKSALYFNAPIKSLDSTSDLDGNKFLGGFFENTLISGSLTNNAVGGKDGFIRKFGGIPGNSFENADTFTVDAPKLVCKTPLIDLGTVCLGQELTHLSAATICNEGTIPLTVTDVYFKVNTAKGVIIVSPKGKVILGELCEFFDIEAGFEFTEVGPFSIVMVIEATCSDPIEITYYGFVKDCCNLTADPIYDFMNVDLNTNKLSQEITLKNESISFKSGNVSIVPGSGNFQPGEYTITQGAGAILLPPGGTHKVVVNFLPVVAGLRTATLDWGFDTTDCGEQITSLIGNGVDIVNVAVTNLDFGRRRAGTSNDGEITLTNGGTSAVALSGDPVIQSPTPGIFGKIATILNSGDQIQPGVPQQVGVQFTPSPTSEGQFAGSYTFQVTGQPDVVATIRGFSFLPKISSTWDCGIGAKIGESIEQTLTLTNPSTTADLTITSIGFINGSGGNFTFKDPQPTGVVIPMGGNLPITIIYEPTAGGNSSTIVNVISDAAPGPDANPQVTTAIPISCSSSGVVAPALNFGSVNGCEVVTQNLVVSNQGSNPVTINSIDFNPSVNSPFSGSANGVVIAPNSSVSIPITFAPTTIGTFNSVISLNLADGEIIVVAVSGTSTLSPISFSIPKQSYNIEPGKNETIPVNATFGNFGSTQITNLDVTITYNPSIVSYQSHANKVQNWNWTAQPKITISNTEESMTFRGSGLTPITTPAALQNLLDITFKPLLGNAEISDFVVSGNYQSGVCTQVSTATTKLQLTNVCSLRLNQITSSGFTYGLMSAFPNPATSSTTVDFSIAFDAHTTIEIVNSYGVVVRKLVDVPLSAGDYRQTVDLTDLPTGYYTLRCLSGLLNATTPIVITR